MTYNPGQSGRSEKTYYKLYSVCRSRLFVPKINGVCSFNKNNMNSSQLSD